VIIQQWILERLNLVIFEEYQSFKILAMASPLNRKIVQQTVHHLSICSLNLCRFKATADDCRRGVRVQRWPALRASTRVRALLRPRDVEISSKWMVSYDGTSLDWL